MKNAVMVLFSVLVLAGCGGDPLVGRWSHSETQQDSTRTSEIEFRADYTSTTRSVITYASTASFLAGCVAETRYEGATWSTGSSGGTMTIQFGGSETVTDSRSNCADPVNDRAASTITQTETAHGTYSLDGNTLTIVFDDGSTTRTVVYTKQ